jgi:hypothetical protein
LGRRTLFHTDRDREHFVELLEGVVGRYRIILHAYVLMGNHYHLQSRVSAANPGKILSTGTVTGAGTWHFMSDGRAAV